jgi:hypothetical protein
VQMLEVVPRTVPHVDPFEVSMVIADWKLNRSLNHQLGDDEMMVRDVSDLDDCYTGGQ